jgi:pimeloyl-CoA synthetase
MTVSELIEALRKFPDDTPVMHSDDGWNEDVVEVQRATVTKTGYRTAMLVDIETGHTLNPGETQRVAVQMAVDAVVLR